MTCSKYTHEEKNGLSLLLHDDMNNHMLGVLSLTSLGWSPSAIAKHYIMPVEKHIPEFESRYLGFNEMYGSDSWCRGIVTAKKTALFKFDDNNSIKIMQPYCHGIHSPAIWERYVIEEIDGLVRSEYIGQSNWYIQYVELRYYFARALRRYLKNHVL
jgi:hypothetical protein